MLNGYANQAKQYKQQQIETASQEELLILLFEGAIRFLNIAKVAHSEKNIEKYHNNLLKAQRILTEFMSSLDMELGGEIAKNLFNLYEYLHYQLVQANIKKDVTMIDEVLNHLRQLKGTWEEAIRIAQQEQKRNADTALQDDVFTDKRALSA
ncbi:MAG: flagellar export chaperone FliS [Cyanobacteria bacterium]|nr:flagellar export chaperone FliS [Cyanobacteriota bacterium]